MRVGVIGLGAGTMACWGRTNDTYRFFEINPKVVDIASNTNYFTYLADSKATVSIGLGDARALLTAETNRYDVLVIDAYSGDAIPLHLATKEAFRLYLDRLNPGGILAVHISNWHIDLNPLCKAVAREQWGGDQLSVISDQSGESLSLDAGRKTQDSGQDARTLPPEGGTPNNCPLPLPTATSFPYSCGSRHSDAKEKTNNTESVSFSSRLSDAKESLKLTGVISPPQGLCSAAKWVFICDRDLPTKGLSVRETDWSQVRDIALPTDARGSLIGLVRYGHRPPEKAVEIKVGAALGH